MTERYQFIDSLRGFSIIMMILTHATAYFPGDKVAFTIWNWSNFAVPIFLFCSVYLFLKKENNILGYFFYLKKRFIRLLVPYYLFLFFFIIALLFVSPEKVTASYVWQSIFLIGGVDINWLVLLFLVITLILPFFLWSYQKARVLFWIFFACSLGSTVFLVFGKFDFSYKWIMWLPWSLVLFFTLLYLRYEQKKNMLLWVLFGCFGVFLSAYCFQVVLAQSTVLIHNKYPPNIFYLSYGVVVLLVLRFLETFLFRKRLVVQTLNFFSTFSYSIYFVHYLVLIVFAEFIKPWHISWITLFLIVFVTTFLLQYGYNVWIRQRMS